ncbi:MAG: hypothetical protein GY832_08945 [Chloroflexi bacterium]|nr:hypothetical protein [Chloroflexota bacterium]
MTDFILRFDQVKESHRDRFGGKGYALARLCQAGFPAPRGFVITADAYHAFVAVNCLNAVIADALSDGAPAMASERIRTAFEEAEIPPSVAAAICDAYLAFWDRKVAVRSSALSEDGAAASFAGQHETFLEIAGCDSLLTAVRCCWASLWSERALAYRDHLSLNGDVQFENGHSDGTPAMAVVVQRMVPAVQSGVAFTLDPVSGRRDVTVVEAIAGVGDALVSGQATPHRYVVSDAEGLIRQGEERPQADESVLDDARLAAVVRLAREVESWAGQPQDVEWALDDAGNVHLLQARPITTEGSIASGSATRWTRDNVGEVIPDPVTPLTWSVLDPLGNRSFAGVLRRLGVTDFPAAGLFGRFYGRVYFNQTLFQSVMSRFYPSHVGWRAAPRLALTALRGLVLLRRLPAESENAISAILKHRDTQCASALAIDRLSLWQRLGMDAMEVHLAVSLIAELLYQTLDKLLARWGDGTINAAALTTGLTGVRSAETGHALAALAGQACQIESLRTVVLETAPNALPARLAETEAGRALWARMEAFLAEYGHCAVQEFELSAPRWRDEPAMVLGALQTHVRAVAETSPSSAGTESGTAARLEATARIEDRLGPLKRWPFRYLLRWVQDFVVIRENLKYHFVIAHSRLRELYLILADQLVTAGRLADPDDVFFLTADEVVTLSDGSLQVAFDFVTERRQAWKADQQTEPPLAFEQWGDGRLSPTSLHAAPDDGGDDPSLRGFAASPGSYTGRARVLRSPSDGTVEPGEVLVVPATSPGWAPLLLAAGALVTEIGGTLSHGAIIAREYGLPAVLNVAGATRHIRTGQLVHVDGSQGTVRLLEEMT